MWCVQQIVISKSQGSGGLGTLGLSSHEKNALHMQRRSRDLKHRARLRTHPNNNRIASVLSMYRTCNTVSSQPDLQILS